MSESVRAAQAVEGGRDGEAALREALYERIASMAGQTGSRLPTERALSEEFGLGRAVVRRVLQDFRRRRLITQAVGRGTFVADDAGLRLASGAGFLPASAAPLSPSDVSPAELMSARLAIEPALIDMVVAYATAADFARMDECNHRAESATVLEDFEFWDAKFHEAVADAAHNGFVARVLRLMNEVRAQSEWGALKRRSVTPQRRLQYQRDHRALADALRERDVDRARALCIEHLKRVRANMFGH
jgi:DNA-binding FadR family transcriptional regulator